MGNYITAELLEERVTTDRLDKLCKVTGVEKTALLESVISRAEGVIDGYASVRYQIPLPSNDLAEEWALTIAEYELHKRGPSSAIQEKIRDSYKDTLAALKDLSAGKMSVPSAIAPQLAASGGSSISIKSNTSLFDETSMSGF